MIPLYFYGVRHPDLFRRSLAVSLRAKWPGPLSITVFTDLLDPEPVVRTVKELALGLNVKVVQTADGIGAAFLTPTPWVAQHEAVLVREDTYEVLIAAAKERGAAVPRLYCYPASRFTATAGNLSERDFVAARARPELEFATALIARADLTADPVESGLAIVLEPTLPVARYLPYGALELVDYRTHTDKVVYDAN